MRSKRGGRIEAEICLYKEVTLQRILTEEETKEERSVDESEMSEKRFVVH